MGITFTSEQQEVIDRRNCNILVSAAAGSGKTAVLVERIITRLTKDNPPLNVDELLIVTFTEAAAAEMKERICAAIEKLLEKEPDNEHLQRQASLIYGAQITTIHSFCLSVIREYFHTIDLEPGFRIGEEGEMKLLKHDVVGELLEEYYQEGKQEFLDFVECYTAGKRDEELEDMILNLYDFSSGYPNPEEWLTSCIDNYSADGDYFDNIASYVSKCMADYIEKVHYMIAQCNKDDGPKAYLEALYADLAYFEKLSNAKSYEEMSQLIWQNAWVTLKSNKGDDVSPEAIERVKSMRDAVKKQVNTLKNQYFYRLPFELVQDMENATHNAKILVELVKRFRQDFVEKKKSRNIIDFSDMEHYALAILKNEKVAEGYRDRFAEVMIDEYQDSSLIQESLLTAVSRISRGQYNIFRVGDVKQSIYSFRLSRPELFMEKYHTYKKGEGNKQRIDLHKNFRSRNEVLESTNFVFRQIMREDLGGICYDDDAALYLGADYKGGDDYQTELLILSQKDLPDKNTKEWEARMVARRIKELVGSFKVTDKKTGELRAAGYGDIVVLTRSLQGWTDVYARVLAKEGIPTHTDSRSGYYETMEIKLLLDYLRVLDNPYQDIPLVAVLTSVFGGITSGELVEVKTSTDKSSFYERICDYAKTEGALADKFRAFLTQLESLRESICYLPMQELLRNVLVETGYEHFVAAMPGGQQRAANLAMLMEKAAAFEKTSYKGLFHFVRYIEQLHKYDVDCGEANTDEGDTESVRLMSIHKSKGLEFPIVFVGGMGKQFNMKNVSSSVAVHAELGIGIQAINYERRTKLPTLVQKNIQRALAQDILAEEMRILYVAMTRAKEKLILAGVVNDLAKKIDSYDILRHVDTPFLFYSQIADARSYLDWVLPAMYRNKSFDEILNACGQPSCFTNGLYSFQSCISGHYIKPEQIAEQEVIEEMTSNLCVAALRDFDTERVYDKETEEELRVQMEYIYPHQKEQELNQKMSVSELKKRAYMEEEGLTFLYEEEEVIPLLPKFLQEQEELTGASRGTAYHRFLELLDYKKEQTEETLLKELGECVSKGYMTQEMAEAVKCKDILVFLQSNIGQRMQQAARRRQLYLEQPFMLGVPVSEIYPDKVEGEMILVQGIIDAYFAEDDELVVVDYKTDHVLTADELVNRYHAQLEYYSKALTQLTGKKVKERKIYSFALRQEIEV